MDNRSVCRGCGSRCCIFKNNMGFVFIGADDARNIKSAIKRDYEYFLDYRPLKKKAVDALRACDPSLEGALRFSQLDKKGRLLRLRTQKDGRCIFLNGAGACEVYMHRPNVCRIYPFWAMRLIDGKLKIIEHGPQLNCPIMVKAGAKQADVEKILSRKQILQIKAVFRSIEREDLLYKKKTAE